ncbi:hypothetical protein PU99_27620 [Pseudomonas putida]|jgi:hypothetical protein|nr:hypothetical protein PU99_27620 [Pseudomonas putida]OMQ39035.1 hypothetical protein BKX96_07395 [Pseudomonas putida]
MRLIRQAMAGVHLRHRPIEWCDVLKFDIQSNQFGPLLPFNICSDAITDSLETKVDGMFSAITCQPINNFVRTGHVHR